MGCTSIFLNGYVGVSDVHAQSQTDTNGTKKVDPGSSNINTMSIWQTLNMVLKMIYLLLWPLLVIAWLALDNTLVYASVFHLDAPLWQFWNMMKNFANFALWFMVLFAIIKSIFMNSWAWSAKDEKSPLGIIKTTLIAWVLIQASWFLVAALVDVSTIATYAVWGLPLSVLKNTTIGNQKILSVNSSLDLNKFNITSAGGEDFQVWYTTKHTGQPLTISPCRVANSYVIWREYWDPKYKNTVALNAIDGFSNLEVCVLFGNQLVMWNENALFASLPCSWWCTTTTKETYKQGMDTLIATTWWDTRGAITGNLVYLSSWSAGIIAWTNFFNWTDSLTISSIITRSKWFVGPLVTIYSSLLNFAQLTNTNITTASGTSGLFIIKALVAIALFFPLIALALVLIARIGVLWLYIVSSPFIILKESFKNLIKIEKLDKYLSINGVIGIIFAPVITVAALSISLIFMTALANGFGSTSTAPAIYETLGITKLADAQPWNDAISFWPAQMEFSKLPWWDAMDRFSWLMINFFAIGLMRMIFFAALEANKLGEKIGGEVEKFGTSFFKTLPILPIGDKKYGVSGVAQGIWDTPKTWVSKRENEQGKLAEHFVFGDDNNKKSPEIISTTQASDIFTRATTPEKIKTEIMNLWVAESGIGNILTASTSNLYEAINKIPVQTQKDSLIKAIADSWLWAGWDKKEALRLATKEIEDKIIVTIEKNTPESAISQILNTDINKPILKKYFDNTDTPYIKNIQGKTLTIKKTSANNIDTYTPTFV